MATRGGPSTIRGINIVRGAASAVLAAVGTPAATVANVWSALKEAYGGAANVPAEVQLADVNRFVGWANALQRAAAALADASPTELFSSTTWVQDISAPITADTQFAQSWTMRISIDVNVGGVVSSRWLPITGLDISTMTPMDSLTSIQAAIDSVTSETGTLAGASVSWTGGVTLQGVA